MPIRPDIDRATIRAEYAAGLSICALSRQYRADERTIRRVLERAGCAIRPPGESRHITARLKRARQYHPEEPAILTAYAAGEPASAIRARHGITQRHLVYMLRRAGVTPRTAAEGKAAAMRHLSAEQRQEVTRRARERLLAKRAAGQVATRSDKGSKRRSGHPTRSSPLAPPS